jgi:hypothetical protein
MKFPIVRQVALACTRAALLAALSCAAQNAAPPPQSSAAQQPQQNQPSGGKVIFSRSLDANGDTTSQAAPAAKAPAIYMASEPTAEDPDRRAITFTAMDLDVHLRTAARRLDARALLTVRNDGPSPLTRIPLQISSALNWERVRIEGKDVSVAVATLNSDTDHTGQLHEAAVPLAAPLAPGKTVRLDVTYSGVIALSAQRLIALGTPQEVAVRSDWDEISVPFTGLRGFGNVVWYPVSSVPVILGDGARLFTEVGEHKLRLSGAHLRVRLTVEFPFGDAPTVAVIDGIAVPLAIASQGAFDPAADGVATATLDRPEIGFEAPSLFVAQRKAHAGPNFTAWTLPDNEVAIQAWISAANAVTPFLADWLGKTPRAQLTLLDLPDPDDAPFETGVLLAASLHESSAESLNGAMVHALTHAWMPSPRAWVNEGVATFMGTLWVEKRHGRDSALGVLEASRAALALEEPPSPGESPGQPIAQAIAPVYYRTKAAYLFWMLRDLIGDDALSQVFRDYAPSQDTAPVIGPGAEPGAGQLEELLRKAAGVAGKDRSWFFADWIDADKGLPDLAIEDVFSEPAQSGTWLVAVNLANAGFAAAEVPVTARAGKTTVTDRVLIPARGKVVHRMLLMGKPTQIEMNDGVVPEVQASVHLKDLDRVPDTTSQPQQQPGAMTPPPIPMTSKPIRP